MEDSVYLGQYLVSKRLFGDAPARHLEADEIKSLKTEIALLRAMIEKRWNMLDNEVDFIAAFPTMKDSFLALEKLVTSCHAMETKLNALVDKGALLSLAQQIVSIIQNRIPSIPDRDEVIENIGNDIAASITKLENR